MNPSERDKAPRRTELSDAKRALLERRLRGDVKGAEGQPVIPRRNLQSRIPLSFAQQRLWFLDQLIPGSAVYNVPVGIQILGSLNAAWLEQGFRVIIERHEVLRTRFLVEEGQPFQVIDATVDFRLRRVDLSEVAAAEREGRLKQLVEHEFKTPFSLAEGPLIACTLYKLAEEEHFLLLNTHHIVADGWSFGVLFDELMAVYEAAAAGQEPRLPPAPIQYADFAIWQREWLQGKTLDGQLEYWRKQLADLPSVFELPTDRARPAFQTYAGEMHRFAIASGLASGLRQISQRERCSLFMTLLAGFQLLLHRYSQQDDVIVGSPIAGRTRRETERMIGFFVNSLVMRTDCGGNPTFRDLLARVREVALGAYAHQDLPFEKLVEELKPERTQAHPPLFQIMFVFHNTPTVEWNVPGLNFRMRSLDRTLTKFDLILVMAERDGNLVARFEYNTDLYDAPTIQRMAGHFVSLLEQIVAQPALRIADYRMLAEPELEQMLDGCRGPEEPVPSAGLHELFEEEAAARPDAVALFFGERSVTYRQLNEQANRIAHTLLERGAAGHAIVGLYLERSPEMVAAMLGVLKTGAAYLPLNTSLPPARIALKLEEARPIIVVTQGVSRSDLPWLPKNVVDLEQDSDCILAASCVNPGITCFPESLAYVIFTSGSTGRPKGVAVEHRSIVNHLMSRKRAFPLAPGDRFLQKAAYSFDISVWEIFAPLLSGAAGVLTEPTHQQDIPHLARLMAEMGVTDAHAGPALLQLLVEDPSFPRCTTLRRMFCGGEPLSSVLEARFFARSPATLHSQYGPTEATVDATWTVCPRLPRAGAAPIGRPIANTSAYVLDPRVSVVPLGLPGQLHIGGTGVARGYLARPDLTAERFIPDPYSTRPGARLYRTGDIARYLPDGNIEFLGRMDHQVKIRGFRVELPEIECVLGAHDAIHDAVVVCDSDWLGHARLAAYLVCKPSVAPDGLDIRSYLKSALPDYMIPAALMWVDSIPTTAHGKVNRRALPDPHEGRVGDGDAYEPPRGPVEEAVAAIWSDFLGGKRVGRSESFFELGGHSLLATQVVSRIYKVFRTQVPLRCLFENPTVAGLSQVLVAMESKSGQAETIARVVLRVEGMSREEKETRLRKTQPHGSP